jgi:Domain of unknown function (DUF4262)
VPKNTVHVCPDPAELARLAAQNVQKYGWHITYLSATDKSPGWAYTIGLFETFHHPEVSVFGLGDDILIGVVNSLAKSVQAGHHYRAGYTYPNILDGVDCIFHSAEALWSPYFFGNATHFYHDREFSMLQCIWPDKQQHFPWSHQFRKDWAWAQPWLFRRYLTDARTNPFLNASSDTEERLIQLREVEHGLNSIRDTMTSACTKHQISAAAWPFENPKTFHAFALRNTGTLDAPITGASHEDDNAWLFFNDEADADSGTIEEVCMGCVLQSTPSISEVADLPRGWMAKAQPGSEWIRQETLPDSK